MRRRKREGQAAERKERKVQRGNQCNLHASKLQTDNEQGASRDSERERERGVDSERAGR